MALNNLKTLTTTTAIVTSVKLIATPADRLGLGFAAGAYSADDLSQGQFPLPHNPEPEQVRSRQDESAPQMRKQTRAGAPDAVPPAGPVGCHSPGSRAVVSWPSLSGANRTAIVTDSRWDRLTTVSVVRSRISRDCQSPARTCDKQGLLRKVTPATTAGK